MTQSKDTDQDVDQHNEPTPADSEAGEHHESGSRADQPGSADSDPGPTSGGSSSEASKRPESGRDSASGGRSGGGVLGVFALLLALAALGLASYPYWSTQDEADAQQAPAFAADQGRALSERLDAVESELAATAREARTATDDTQSRTESLDEEIESLGAAIESLEQQLGTLADDQASMRGASERIDPLIERVGRLEGTQSSAEASLEARMSALEQRIEQRVESLQQRLGSLGADLEEAGRESARRLALIHARALLVQGRDRLEVSGDTAGAQEAFRRALDALRSPDEVPQSTIDALNRLVEDAEALEPLPVAERVRALDTLAASANDWPAPEAATEDQGGNDVADADAGWRDRMASAMGRLVRVESIDAALPNRAEVDRARERIRAALSAAAVASAREDWDTASALIERARADVVAFLDPADSRVRQALQRMDELIETPQVPNLPAAWDEARIAVAEALEPGR